MEHFLKKFEIRILIQIDRFLSIKVEESGRKIKLHKKPMIKGNVLHFSMKEGQAVVAPLPTGLDLTSIYGDKLREISPSDS